MKVYVTAAFEQHMLFDPTHYPVQPPKPVIDPATVPNAPVFSSDVLEDLEYLPENVSVEDVLDHHGIEYEVVKLGSTTKITADIDGTKYVIDPTDGNHREAQEWLYTLSESEIYDMCPPADFNKDFWESPPHELYHATDEGNIPSIRKQGLKMRCKTRGFGNKHTGCAVFAASFLLHR